MLGNDECLFWQHAEDCIRAMAELYKQLGLASYDALEVFVECDTDCINSIVYFSTPNFDYVSLCFFMFLNAGFFISISKMKFRNTQSALRIVNIKMNLYHFICTNGIRCNVSIMSLNSIRTV